jgi:hypothetical protein
MTFKAHIEVQADGTVLSTDHYPGQDIDPRSGWCSIRINGTSLRDKNGNPRKFRTFAAAKKAALAAYSLGR